VSNLWASAVLLHQVPMQLGLLVGTGMRNIKQMFRSKNWIYIDLMNDKQYIYNPFVLSGTFCTNLQLAFITYTAFNIDEEFSLDFYLFLKRFWVLFIEIGSPCIAPAALNLLYCLMDLQPVILLTSLKMCVKPHQV
jgi:hypothetical protein